MGFRKDKTGAAQTAANASATLTAAFADSFGNFKEATEAYNELREAIYADLAAVVDADNEMFAAQEGSGGSSNGSSKGSSRRSNGSSSRKTGGSKRGGSKGSSKVTLDDALGMELNYGAFKGETLGDVLGFDVDTCEEDFDYGDGERDGKDYIAWLAGDSNENEFVQRRARLIADENGIEY